MKHHLLGSVKVLIKRHSSLSKGFLVLILLAGSLALSGTFSSADDSLKPRGNGSQDVSRDSSPSTPEPIKLSVEIPRLNVSEYHRPYVAIWVEDTEHKVKANLAVWYQMRAGNEGAGTKWLPDLRQWWRRTGRELDLPVDGISGATRPVGKHELTFDHDRFGSMEPGEYTLIIEAAREVGGREVVKLPFKWPITAELTLRESGEKELGEIVVKLQPGHL